MNLPMFTPQEIEAYRRDGYVVARGVLGVEDVAALREEVDRMWQRSGDGVMTQNVTYQGVKKISTIRDPQLHSGLFTRYLSDPRLTERMAELIGPNVQLHHSKLNVKTTADRVEFPLHQDYPYFPHAKHSLCTVVVHLTDVTSRRGCFRVIPGVHEPIEHVGDGNHYLDPAEYRLQDALEVPGAAGDVIFMNYLTPHGSNLNEEPEPRILWIIQVRAADDRPLPQPPGTAQSTEPGNRPSQGTMLRGVNPDFQWTASGKSRKL